MSASSVFAATEPAVELVFGTAWSPNDSARDGAAEFELLVCAARLRQSGPLGGIVGVGKTHGAFSPAGEVALQRIAYMGLPVVRVASIGSLPAHPGDAFIEAGSLSPAEARRVLLQCLARYGAPPAAKNPARPTAEESAALQTKLVLYQKHFDESNAVQVAMR